MGKKALDDMLDAISPLITDSERSLASDLPPILMKLFRDGLAEFRQAGINPQTFREGFGSVGPWVAYVCDKLGIAAMPLHWRNRVLMSVEVIWERLSEKVKMGGNETRFIAGTIWDSPTLQMTLGSGVISGALHSLSDSDGSGTALASSIVAGMSAGAFLADAHMSSADTSGRWSATAKELLGRLSLSSNTAVGPYDSDSLPAGRLDVRDGSLGQEDDAQQSQRD